jgi:hypothetical protein
MKIIKVNGECVNLSNDFEQVKTSLSVGFMDLMDSLFNKKSINEKFDVIATKRVSYASGVSTESVVLGTYESEYRAKQVCTEVVNAWGNNKNMFTMPER